MGLLKSLFKSRTAPEEKLSDEDRRRMGERARRQGDTKEQPAGEMSEEEKLSYWGRLCEMNDLEERLRRLEELAESGFDAAWLSMIEAYFAQSDARERLAAQAPVPAQCRQCRYLPTCNGSCLRERYVLGYPYRCRSNRLYWDHVTAWLQEYGCSLYMLLGKSPAEKRETIDRIFKKR